MAFDLQKDGWPGDEDALQGFQKIRERVISGLVRLAGAEPVPQGSVKDTTQELSDEGRYRLLDEALTDLAGALRDLDALISARPPALPAALGVPNDLAQTVAGAIADVNNGLADVRAIQRVNGAIGESDGFKLKQLPDQVRPNLSRIINVWSPLRKVFVAVHGIGDQFQSETVQSVAYRVCDYVGVPTALPLGRFHGPGGAVARVFVPEPDRDPPINCGFAEIYWADVPRAPAANKHILEEPRKWARTLIERLRLRTQKPLDREMTARYTLTLLPALADRGAIPGRGSSEIVVAEVDKVLHFRIFDVDGTPVVDTDEGHLKEGGRALEGLRRRLATSWPPRVPSRRRKDRIIASVISIVDQTRTREDDERLEQLLEELIVGVNVADRLSFLAEKAGLFKFDLAELLNNYINDVQVVTEFEDYRRQLLDIFDDVLTKIHRYFEASEIYLVAHSEGTVVSFLGLLKGLSGNAPWAASIRGYMTIGSPLNKHVRFWPDLFNRYAAASADANRRPIPWKNYYDFGDPIGYDLSPTRSWMQETGWDRHFVFRDERNRDDIGFTRYYFPAEAHNEYWQDETVFGHFIEEVVDRTNTVLRRARKTRHGTPGTRVLASLTSYPMPYVLSAGLLFLASYLLYKAVRGCLDPAGSQSEGPFEVLRNVLGLSGIVGGMSLLARIPRLARGAGWRLLAVVLAALFSAGYFLTAPHHRASLESFLTMTGSPDPYLNFYNRCLIGILIVGAFLMLAEGLRPAMLTLLPVVLMILVFRCIAAPSKALAPSGLIAVPWASLAVIAIGWLIGIRAWRVSWLYPSLGTKPLIHTGGLIILLIVVTEFAFNPSDRGPIWPVVLAGAAYLYIWWLAVLVFDLTFVWHVYIRWSGAQKYVDARLGPP